MGIKYVKTGAQGTGSAFILTTWTELLSLVHRSTSIAALAVFVIKDTLVMIAQL
jgi:hypothetical protein